MLIHYNVKWQDFEGLTRCVKLSVLKRGNIIMLEAATVIFHIYMLPCISLCV